MDREEEKMTATFNRVVQSYIVASFLSIRSFSLSSSFLTGERERTGEGGRIYPFDPSNSPFHQPMQASKHRKDQEGTNYLGNVKEI